MLMYCGQTVQRVQVFESSSPPVYWAFRLTWDDDVIVLDVNCPVLYAVCTSPGWGTYGAGAPLLSHMMDEGRGVVYFNWRFA